MRLRVLSAAVALAALLVVAAPASAGTDLRGERDHPIRPTILVWGVGLFTRRSQFEIWLRAHGGQSFSSWRRQHPDAMAILAAAARPVVFRRSQLAPMRSPAPPPAAVVSGVTSAREPSYWQLGVLLALATLLLAGAVLPARLVVATRLPRGLDDRRWLLGAAGSAILIGVAAAGLSH